jgi:hypothetical protein
MKQQQLSSVDFTDTIPANEEHLIKEGLRYPYLRKDPSIRLGMDKPALKKLVKGKFVREPQVFKISYSKKGKLTMYFINNKPVLKDEKKNFRTTESIICLESDVPEVVERFEKFKKTTVFKKTFKI